jgi:energy-coupling factor transport system ATP-binding protein
MPDSPLAYRELSFQYEGVPRRAVEGLNLSVEHGEWLLVCGASGSGKTTLVRAAIGLVPHFYAGTMDGHVSVGGLDTRSHPVYELFRKAALVFQNPEAQLFNSSVENEIAYALEPLGLSRPEMRKRIARASDDAGVGHLLSRSPHSLSGGEQQRVAIAAALALQPPMLILDEPFAHLDGEAAVQLRAGLKRIRSEGTTVMVVEHRLHELVADANRIALLDQGKLALCGTPRAMLANDVEAFGVGKPFAARLFRERGWDFVPLDSSEAAEWLKRTGLLLDWTLVAPDAMPRPAKNAGAEPVLTLEAVAFAHEHMPILTNVTFQIQRGESVALLGRNGAGKTTLLKMLVGLHRPQHGHIDVAGLDAGREPPASLARQAGLVFQNANNQLFMPSVREELEIGAKRLKVFDPSWQSEIVSMLGLELVLERTPFRLSEGEKKRVAIASVLAMRPALIALDEPTVGQDDTTRRALIALLRRLLERGHTLLVATHDLEFAEAVAPRWLVLADGRISADGEPDAIMADERVMQSAGLAVTDRFMLNRAVAMERNRAVA